MNRTQRFDALDSLRGICALLVISYHLRVLGAFTEFQFFRDADILINFFFILSGFVLAHTYGTKSDLDYRAFAISRTFRLFPLHVVMLGVFVVLEFGRWLAWKGGLPLNNEPFTALFAPIEILPNLFLLQAWTTLTETMSFNYPSWSISIEYYVYLLFGGISLLSMRNRGALWGLLALVAYFLLIVDNQVMVERALIGISCFFTGNVVYLGYTWLRPRVALNRLLMTVLEVVVLALVYYVVVHHFPYRAVLASLLFSSVVVVFAFEGGWVTVLMRTSPFKLLGLLAYSIYMTHAAVLFCLVSVFLVAQKLIGFHLSPMVGTHRFLDTGSALGNHVLSVAVILTCIGVAALAHKYIEVPGQAWGRRIIKRKAAGGQIGAPAPVSVREA